MRPLRQLTAGEPELDLAGRGIGRIGAVDEVVLGDEGQVTADGAGCGLLDGIGPAGDLPERGNGPRALDDGGHHGPGGNEFQQRREERLALVLGVVLPGERRR